MRGERSPVSPEGAATRESVPFRITTAAGEVVELSYSSPRPAAEHDESAVVEQLPWFDTGQPLHNWMLHDTDFYDEVEQIWGQRWGAEGIGKLREVLVSAPDRERDAGRATRRNGSTTTRAARGNADLGRLQAQFDEYYEVLENNGVRVNYLDPPVPAIAAYGYLKNLVTLAGGGLIVRGGAIIHRMGLGSWQRGREVIWSKALASLQVPIYLTIHGRGIGEPGAGRWLDSRTFVFNESVVANEDGLAQIQFILEGLGIELVTTHSPGWVGTTGEGNIGTTHADMFVMVPDIGVAVLAPHLVNYGFVRYLNRRDVRDHRGARRGVLGPRRQRGHARARAHSHERGIAEHGARARARRHRGDPGRLLRKPQVRDRRAALRHTRARPGPARPATVVSWRRRRPRSD